jgi:hypothetical protein
MSEAELQGNIIDMAHRFGWLIHAERTAVNMRGVYSTPIQGDTGFPDLIIAKRKHLYFVELKSESGNVSEAQQVWWRCLSSPKYQLWRPRDWFSGYIEQILKG